MILIILFQLLTLTGLNPNQVSHNHFIKSKTPTLADQQKGFDYVILPSSQMIGNDFKGYKEGILEPEDFNLINSKLTEFVDEYNGREKKQAESIVAKYLLPKRHSSAYDQLIRLSSYKRQYICVVDRKGDKIVWVNCFCSEQDYWKKQRVFVSDGGNCFFNLKINLTKKIKYDEMVNGVA